MLVQQELTGSVGHEIVCKAYIMPKPFANALGTKTGQEYPVQ